MTYVARRISVTDDQGKSSEYVDADFLSLEGPLVILGEPGSGKSELVRDFCRRTGSQLIDASSINLIPSVGQPTLPGKIVVDGVDEITAYDSNLGIVKVLEALKNHTVPNFILTCRAVDWQAAINSKLLESRWQRKPTIGRLLPLNHQEITEFINSKQNMQHAEEFISSAEKHDAKDLLSNPQHLSMLLKVVQSEGWPDSRLKLYQAACNLLLNEDNEVHDSLNKNRPTIESLADISGFICAQLLLSGGHYISVFGEHAGSTKLKNFSSDKYPYALLRSALSTKIFRLAGAGFLEVCHRTIAEYLAARWLSTSLKSSLSRRRLESVIYGKNYIVPSALRGLHAWIATLSPSIANDYIRRDSYGFLKYGDPSALTVEQSKNLLQSLDRMAQDDPYFNREDWNVSFGGGLAKIELKDDILSLLRNPSTPPYLSHLIFEFIRGEPFVEEILEDLVEILCDTKATPIERHGAYGALVECSSKPNWQLIVNKLIEDSGEESLKIAIDIVEEKNELFDGKAVAEVLIALQKTGGSETRGYIGLGYRIAGVLSCEQLDIALERLVAFQSSLDRDANVQRWIFKFAQERLLRGEPPRAEVVLSWFNRKDEYGYEYEYSSWRKFCTDYFSKNSDLRNSVQHVGLNNSKTNEEYRESISLFTYVHQGICLTEDDFIKQANFIVNSRNENVEWIDRWSCLVHAAKLHSNFNGAFLGHVKNQSKAFPELQIELRQIEKLFQRSFDGEVKKWEKKHSQEVDRNRNSRHLSYKKVQDKLRNGTHLRALSDVAKAYLGLFIDFDKSLSPEQRVAELVGVDTVSDAIVGLELAIKNFEVPSVRKIHELHAFEGKEYLIETILIAQMLIAFEKDRELKDIPIDITKSTLGAYRWGLYSGSGNTSKLQAALEKIVFSSKSDREQFIRDSVEPYLVSGASHIAGLYRFSREDEFCDVVGPLASEWLSNHKNVSKEILQELVVIAIKHSPKAELLKIVHQAISDNVWGDDEGKKSIWIGVAFLLDFEANKSLIQSYAEETPSRIWSFRDIAYFQRSSNQYWPKLSEAQIYFLISVFGPLWPPVERPMSWSGNQNPWDGYDIIRGCIRDLGESLSDETGELFERIIGENSLVGYRDSVKHIYAQYKRRYSESMKGVPTHSEIREILMASAPINHDDLQALVLDQLEELQDRARNGQTNDVLIFWNGDTPHSENYCRDRITSLITPYLDRFGVRVHTEGTMPGNERCDLLSTYKMMDLPIEIKGQWHKDIWSAAETQLANYLKEYRAQGHGIYLVLWFGHLGANATRNPRGWTGQPMPTSFEEFSNLIKDRYKGISDRTKIFALDLSKLDNS